jgi:TctA family transporter
MIEAFFLAISPSYLMYMTIGVLLGLVVGTLPGLTATMGTALLVPFTFAYRQVRELRCWAVYMSVLCFLMLFLLVW